MWRIAAIVATARHSISARIHQTECCCMRTALLLSSFYEYQNSKTEEIQNIFNISNGHSIEGLQSSLLNRIEPNYSVQQRSKQLQLTNKRFDVDSFFETQGRVSVECSWICSLIKDSCVYRFEIHQSWKCRWKICHKIRFENVSIV